MYVHENTKTLSVIIMISLITFCIIVSQDDLLFDGFYSFILGKKDLIGIVNYSDKGYVMGSRSRSVCVRDRWVLYS